MRFAPLLPRVCAAAVLAAAACSSSSNGAPDGGPDAGPRPHPVPGPGQSAAWQITDEADLIGGPSTAGKKGDWILANARVKFIVEGVHASDGYDPHGCSVVAADRQRPPGTPGESRFGEVVLLLNFRGTGCGSIELVSDGSDDGVAWVRATGHDEVLPYAASLFSEGSEPPRLNATIIRDYVLAPDSDALQLTLTVRNDGADTLSLQNIFAAMAMNRGLRHWVPGSGFDFDDIAKVNPNAEFYAALGERVSYSLLNLDSPYSPLLSFAKVLFGKYTPVTLPPGQARTWRLIIGVGTGDAGSLQAIHAQVRGASSSAAKLSGAAVGPSGEPIANARVHITDSTGARPASFARSAADGTWSAAIPAGNYLVKAVADDRTASAQQAITLPITGVADLKLALGPTSRIEVTATGERGPIPAKIIAEPVAFGRPNYPSSLGEKWSLQPTYAFAEAGKATLDVFPAEWKVTVARGFEYDLKVFNVTAQPGAVSKVAAQLTRVVDTSGWLSGDYHVHAQNSIDGEDLLAEKVRAFAAEGVEIAVSTEHEYVADFAPTVKSLGLGAFLHAIGGTELTTTFIGHFNIFPLVPDATKVNGGAFAWYNRLVPDVIAEARTRVTAAGVPIVQMNHPRSLGMSYLDAVGFDPASFKALDNSGNAPHFTSAWDAMEVWNGTPLPLFEGCPVPDPDCVAPIVASPTAPDWFSFLDRGLRVAGMGNSDSHSRALDPVGYPRTYVRVGTDDPAAVTDAAVSAAIRAQAVVVSGGPFILTSALDKNGVEVGPGGTAAANWSSGSGVVPLKIDVQAPTWMGPLSRVDVWRGDAHARNGAVIALSIDLTQGPYKDDGTSVRRLSATFPVSVSSDTWLVATVRSKDANALYPMNIARVPPFAIANPIWIDADGDGKIKPLK